MPWAARDMTHLLMMLVAGGGDINALEDLLEGSDNTGFVFAGCVSVTKLSIASPSAYIIDYGDVR